MVRLGRLETIIWAVLLFAAGCVVGMCVDALLNVSAKAKTNCNDGTSEQLELQAKYNFAAGEYQYTPVRKKTYIPANDTCKEDI